MSSAPPSSSVSVSACVSAPQPDAALSRLPSALLLQLANDWLKDRDVARWAATERRMLRVMQAYRIKDRIDARQAWKWKWKEQTGTGTGTGAEAEAETCADSEDPVPESYLYMHAPPANKAALPARFSLPSSTDATAAITNSCHATATVASDSTSRHSSSVEESSSRSSSSSDSSPTSICMAGPSKRRRVEPPRLVARIGRLVTVHTRIDTPAAGPSVHADAANGKGKGNGLDVYNDIVVALSLSSLPRSVREVLIHGWSNSISTEVFNLLASVCLPDWIEVLDLSRWNHNFECRNNPPLLRWALPRKLLILHLPSFCTWHGALNQLTLPHSLSDLHLGAWQGTADQLPTVPPNLQAFNMGSKFNSPIDSIQWPQSLQSLTLSSAFNHPLECVRLPDSITSLVMHGEYNHPIERMVLPASLTKLDLGTLKKFNHPLEQLRLPSGLRFLALPSKWNHPLERLQFPDSFTQLRLGNEFNHPLVNWKPPAGLTSMEMPKKWKLGPSKLRLPANLTQLTLSERFNEAHESLSLLRLPSTLQTLQLAGTMEGNDLDALTFPASLTSLHLGDECDASLDDVAWPPRLTHLCLGLSCKQPLDNWSPPASLTELELGDEYGAAAEDDDEDEDEDGDGESSHPPNLSQLRLPPNLRKLTFGNAFNQPLTGLQFPPSLRVIRFGEAFDQSLARSAWCPPHMLEELDMDQCCDWNRPCTELYLPAGLRRLTLPRKFNQPLKNEHGECQLHLPSTLTELRFKSKFSQPLRSLHLPASLRILSIPSPSAKYSVDELPPSLPARLQYLKVFDEVYFQSSWAQHPTWPKQCAVGYGRGE